jgi:hypothetical protein
MPTLWDDKIRSRNPKQLTIFVAPRLNKLWRRAFDDALKTFNTLSATHRLGVTMVETSTKPDADGDGGADVQFDMGKGDLTYTALGQTTVVKGYAGTSMHGNTQLVSLELGNHSRRIHKAFVFVPETPMIAAQMQVGRNKFNQVQREAGHGVKHFIAAHELIHVCGLLNSDHTQFGADADLFIQQPQPDAGPFSKPDEDRLLLYLTSPPKPNVFSPPIFLNKATIDAIKQNWS